METVDLSAARIDPTWAFKVPPALALRRLALALCEIDGRLALAMAEPDDRQTADAVAAAVGIPVAPLAADRQQLREALLRVYGDGRTGSGAGAGDPVAVVDRLLRAAALREASDIHLNPMRDGMEVRLRIDGALETFGKLAPELFPAVTSRIKVMAGLDIAEKRAPQDGGFAWTMPGARSGAAGRAMDIRVATLPVRHGERVTLRLLESGRDRLTLDGLGMEEKEKARFRSVLETPHGLVLMTGPTGSGKTTTLYAAIRELLDMAPLNILTVEDPVEYEIEGVSQAQVDAGDKVNFARALRSLLRHDPDVVMIGEIRDDTSLDTALKAALTGHLVLSTLHAGDAVGSITRLRDMGAENHLLASTLRLGASQRLVRKLCPRCSADSALSGREAALLGRPELRGAAAKTPCGCLACAGKGYNGRTGVFEFMAADEELSALVASGAGEKALREHCRGVGEKTMAEAAVGKILRGETDVAEVLKAFGPCR